MAAFGPTMTWGFGCISVAAGVAAGGFALTARHFFQTPKKYPKRLAPAFGPRRLGFLRYGTDPGAAATVCFAAPPSAVFDFVERSLRSHARINPSTQPSDVARGSRSKAGELTLGLLSGEERGVVGVGFVVDSPLTPALSRRERELTEWFGRSTPTCSTEPNLDFEALKQEPLTLALPKRRTARRERGLTEWFGEVRRRAIPR